MRAPAGNLKTNPLFTRAVIMVDDATEPGIGDIEGEHRRIELVNLVLSGGDVRRAVPAGNSPGAAVAYAIRKRLKSDDHVAVLNTLTLLDEIMRTCPYFYRYVASDKFFRRLWRFVDPEYKTDLRGKIPFWGKSASKQVAATRSDAMKVELAERVLILIRAWAEDLSIMFSGSYDTHAGFFIERYTNKRLRIKFPEVPATGNPWICPVPTSSARSRFASGAGPSTAGRRGTTHKTTSPLPQSLTLDEVVNTVNLFSNILEKAMSIEEIRGDVCAELAERCRLISQNIDTLSARMEHDEDLSTAIRVSEQLQKSLATYDKAVNEGVFENAPPVVDGLTDDDSEDEGYDDAPYRPIALPIHPIGRGSNYYEDPRNLPRDPDALRGSRDDLAARDTADRLRDYDGRRIRSEDRYDRTDLEDGRYIDEHDAAGRTRDKLKSRRDRDVDKKRPDKKDPKKMDAYSSKASSTKSDKSDKSSSKGTKSSKKDSNVSPETSARTGKSKPHKQESSNALVDVAAPQGASSSDSSDTDDDGRKGTGFGILADRYAPPALNRSSKQSSKAEPGSSAVLSAVGGVQNLSISPTTQQQYSSVPHHALSVAAGHAPGGHDIAMHQAQFPYSSVVMMPNPAALSLYGSYNPHAPPPAPYQSPQAAYSTVNPALYYNTVNPLIYGSVSSAMPLPLNGQNTAVSTPGANSSASPTGGTDTAASTSSPSSSHVNGATASTSPTGGSFSVHPLAPAVRASPASTPFVSGSTSVPPPPARDSLGLASESSPVSHPGDSGRLLQQHSVSVLPPAVAETVPHSTTQDFSRAPQPPQSQPHLLQNGQQQSQPQQQQQQLVHSGMTATTPPLVPVSPDIYSSVTGHPPLGAQALYSSIRGGHQPLDTASRQTPNISSYPPPVTQSIYSSVGGFPVHGSVPHGADQAAIYQSAMANAAAAYHAAASAYHSVQNQPVFGQEEPGAASVGAIPPPPAPMLQTSAQDSGAK